MDYSNETLDDKKARAVKIVGLLKIRYTVDPGTALDYKTPLDLLVATILSAQCTDVRVNIVTRELFRKYRKAVDYAKADLEAFGQEIKSTGFYNNKAKNIISCCAMIVKEFGGEVPEPMEDLVRLPGVGRKTANLVRGIVFGRPGIVTDTHVIRVSTRLGLTDKKDPEKIEYDLNALIPEEEWTGFSSRMVMLGREVCTARNPDHASCELNNICPSAIPA